MASNKTVLIGGGVIVTVGFVGAVVKKGNPTRVVTGGIVFILLASLLELAGPRASQLASGIVGVAVLTVVLAEAPSIGQAYANAQKNVGNPTNNTNQNTMGTAVNRSTTQGDNPTNPSTYQWKPPIYKSPGQCPQGYVWHNGQCVPTRNV